MSRMKKHQIFFYWFLPGLIGSAVFIPLRPYFLIWLDVFIDIVPNSLLPPGTLKVFLFSFLIIFIVLLPGLTIALGQWILLLRHYGISAWWVAVSGTGRLGFALTHITVDLGIEDVVWADFYGVALLATIGGAIFGGLQALFLRTILKQRAAYIWATVFGSVIGWWYVLLIFMIGNPTYGIISNWFVSTHSLPALAQAVVLSLSLGSPKNTEITDRK